MAENVFHEMLRLKRKNAGLTLVELAQHLGVSKSAISDYENRVSEPTLSFLERTAAYFQIDIQSLVFGEPSANLVQNSYDESMRIQILNQRIDALIAQIGLLQQLNQSKDSEIAALRMQIMLLKHT